MDDRDKKTTHLPFFSKLMKQMIIEEKKMSTNLPYFF